MFSKLIKTLWEKEKFLVTGNFSFSNGVFKRLLLQTHKKQGFFGKRVKGEKGIQDLKSPKKSIVLVVMVGVQRHFQNISKAAQQKVQLSMRSCNLFH